YPSFWAPILRPTEPSCVPSNFAFTESGIGAGIGANSRSEMLIIGFVIGDLSALDRRLLVNGCFDSAESLDEISAQLPTPGVLHSGSKVGGSKCRSTGFLIPYRRFLPWPPRTLAQRWHVRGFGQCVPDRSI